MGQCVTCGYVSGYAHADVVHAQIRVRLGRERGNAPLSQICHRMSAVQMPHMHQYLQHMEPLPEVPELQAAQAMLGKLHRGVSLADELVHFVARAAALPAVLRFRALAAMELGMRQRQHELLQPEGCAYWRRPSRRHA